MSRSAPTSIDVARKAGVSQATVSVVLSGTRSNIRISDATRQRVLTAAMALDYMPNPAAQALRRKRSGIFAFVTRANHDAPLNQTVPLLLNVYTTRAAIRRGFHTIVLDEMSSGPGVLAADVRRHRVDGVFLHSPHDAAAVRQIVASGIPTVQLIRPQLDVFTPLVTHDFSDAIRAAVDYFVVREHRRIAFVGSTSPHPFDRGREEQFRAALAHHGIPLPEEYVQRRPVYGRAEGTAMTARLLALPAPPTAIFAGGDVTALGVMYVLYARGIRVPDAMDVVSFGAASASYLVPPIPSVTLPLEELASRAVDVLIDCLDTPTTDDAAPAHITFPARFVVPDTLSLSLAAETGGRNENT